MEFAAGIVFLMSLGFLAYYRSVSKQNFFFRRAPQLNIDEIHTFDDGWFTGTIEAPEVLVAPFFGNSAVSFHYCLYEKVVKYEKDSNGNSRRVETWELYDSASGSVPFYLNDGTGKLLINPGSAIQKFPHGNQLVTENWKHTLSYFPSSGVVSSVGVVSESKKQLINKGETPLMITPMGRKSFMDAIKSEEKFAKYGGFITLWGSFICGLYAVDEHYLQLPLSDMSLFGTMSLAATVPFAGCYYYFTHNSLVSLRMRLINSWANVDIELKNRRELIPNLVKVCEEHLAHEKINFHRLVELRNSIAKEKRLKNRINIENKISKNLETFVATIEAYPELNDESIQLLQKNLVTIENKISHAKSHFNAVVEEYNNLVEGFPSSLIANYKKFVSVPFYGERDKEDLNKMGKLVDSKPTAITAKSAVPITEKTTKNKQTVKKAS